VLTILTTTAVHCCVSVCYCIAQTEETIRQYLSSEVVIAQHYSSEIVSYLDTCPKKPHEDPVQVSLVQLMQVRMQQQEKVLQEDRYS
jgi:hypothetical protein